MNDHRRPILGVSACLFRAGKVLLVERARAPFEGLLSFPGGTLRFGETLAEGIAREVREETALDLGSFAFHCLHEAIDEASDIHAVIAVHRAAHELPLSATPVPGDDARSLAFHPVDGLAEMERQGLLTSGLAKVAASAHRAHLLGL